MQKFILFTLVTAAAYAYSNEPVKGAVYAEIRATHKDGCIRIYKGAGFRHSALKNLFSKIKYHSTPTLLFFDENGHKIAQEKLSHWPTDDSWKLKEEIISGIQSRLTELPQAHHAKSTYIKSPRRECVELFDKKGMLIARTNLDFFGYLEVGKHIPEEAINILKNLVANPDILQTLIIVERSNGALDLSLHSLLFGY